MNRRHFRLCPPSFPKHYTKNRMPEGWVYLSRYISPHGPISMLSGTNEWFDYMGDIIMGIHSDLEQLEIKDKQHRKHPERQPVRGPFEGKQQLVIPSRLNQP